MSAPLTPALMIGDRSYTSVRLRCSAPGPGVIEFDSRQIALDGFGNSIRPGPPRLATAPVELVEVKDAPRVKAPEPAAAPGKPETSSDPSGGPKQGASPEPNPVAPAGTASATAEAAARESWRVFIIQPASTQAPNSSSVGRTDWTGVLELRLACGPSECGPWRLLVLEKAGPNMDRIGSVRRVITLEPATP